MREIFDFHLHPFIDVANSIGQYGVPEDWRAFVAHLKGQGITGCAGTVIRRITRESFEPVKDLNDQALRFRDLNPDFYVPGIHVHGFHPQESCEELLRMHAEGVKLIGELVWYYMDYPGYGTEEFKPVWELAEKLGMVVSIHPTTIEDMEKMIAPFPKLKVVIAHPGEKKDYMAKIDLLKRYPNAFMDICGTGLFRYGMLQYGVHELGAERFLFGTDYPVCSVGVQIGGVDAEPLTDAERTAIYSGNAKRLLG